MKLQNKTQGVRGIRDADGKLHNVEPGATVDIEPGEGEMDAGWFGEPDGDAPEADTLSDGEMTADQVRDAAQQAMNAMRAEFDRRLQESDDRATNAESERDQLKAELQSTKDQLAALQDSKSTGSEPPALSGKNKDQLLEIAKAEGVAVPEGATNDAIRDAIEAKRKN